MTNFSGKNLNAACGGPQGGGMDSRRNGVAEVSSEYLAEAASSVIPVGYKQTEVGVIPEDWEVVCFDQLKDKKDNWAITGGPFGSNLKASDYTENGVRVIQLQNIGDGVFKNDDFVYTSYKKANELISCNIYPDEIILSKMGDPVARACLIPHFHSRYVMCSDGIRLKVDSQRYSEKFVFYFLNYPLFRNQALDASTGSTRKRIGLSELRDILLCVPPKEEQIAIANALSDVDALISELEKLIAKKQAIKTATMQQLLTGRTRLPQFALRDDGTPTNSSGTNLDAGTGGPKGEGHDGLRKGTKPSELGEIPEDWEVMRLGHLAKFFKGSGLPKSELSESGKIKCIHYGQLFTTYGPKIDRVISRTQNVGIVTSQENDVLMPTSDVTPNGLATASCITETGVTLGGDILIIRSDKQKLNGVFFSYLVNVLRDQVMQLVTGSTVYHLYGSDMAKFEFAFPSKEEQTTIATILSDMDEEIQALEQRLGKTRQIKQGMMQELLTGKTRLLRGVVND